MKRALVRKTSTMSVALLFAAGTAVLTPATAAADAGTCNISSLDPNSDNFSLPYGFSNFNEVLEDMYFHGLGAEKKRHQLNNIVVNTGDVEARNVKATILGSAKSSVTESFGQVDLKNGSNQSQQIVTPARSASYVDGYTIVTGAGVATTVGVKTGLLLGDFKVGNTNTQEVSLSNPNECGFSETNSFTYPQTSITVPPHSWKRLNLTVTRTTRSADISTSADFSGTFNIKWTHNGTTTRKTGIGIAKAFDAAVVKGWSPPGGWSEASDGGLHFIGAGGIRGITSHYNADVVDVCSGCVA